jgi:hypothetical protein
VTSTKLLYKLPSLLFCLYPGLGSYHADLPFGTIVY